MNERRHNMNLTSLVFLTVLSNVECLRQVFITIAFNEKILKLSRVNLFNTGRCGEEQLRSYRTDNTGNCIPEYLAVNLIG